ncbi:hypothetical protein BGZ99_006645 [Dissophora globulifera]|uniref:Uncharacterized protein n=1 Tax=Dissophora globulifera TaxID=979702 RepID=A0A9P6RE75_9FUNG|nr:hypothetical protein BGZ99_006645 [Dissophora globulifera]
MIPTQEVLQNLDRYSGIEKNYSRAHREQDEAAKNDNDSDHDIPLGQQQYSNSTVSNYDSSPIPPSPTPLISSRLLQKPPSTVQSKAVHLIVQEPQRTLKSPGRPASRNSTTASSRPMGLQGDERRLEDLDPIMDFDDSDDDLGLMDCSRLEKEKKKDADSIVSTFPRDSISSPLHYPNNYTFSSTVGATKLPEQETSTHQRAAKANCTAVVPTSSKIA